MSKEYKKTWKPFVISFLVYLAVMFSTPFIMNKIGAEGKILTKMTFLITALWLIILMFMIYKGQYVYWITGGPSFKEARDAGYEARKLYAGKHLKRFFMFLVPFIVYMIISCIYNFSVWIDIAIFAVSVISAAFSTVTIKFDSDKF